MKNHFFLLAAIAVSAFTIQSCTKQSRLDIESLKGSATIFGTARYDAGDKGGDQTGPDWRPAAGEKIIISVSYSGYTSGSSSGQTTFNCTVDADGKYRISIPVGNLPANASVTMAPFLATKKVLVDGKLVSIPDALYNSNTVNLTVEDQFIYEANLNAYSDAYPENL